MIKYCKDCKWCRPKIEKPNFILGLFLAKPKSSFEFARCGHPSSTDLVSGEPTIYCSTDRSDFSHVDTCGTSGKNFEPLTSDEIV